MDHTSQDDSAGQRRKRNISECDQDASEFLPLSKRINNLHLNGSSHSPGTVDNTPYRAPEVHCQCSQLPSTSNRINQCAMCNPHLIGVARQALPLPDLLNIPNNNEMMMSPSRTPPPGNYSPDMDVHTNPHYYTPNKLLFDMHIERVKRHGILFKPNKYDG